MTRRFENRKWPLCSSAATQQRHKRRQRQRRDASGQRRAPRAERRGKGQGRERKKGFFLSFFVGFFWGGKESSAHGFHNDWHWRATTECAVSCRRDEKERKNPRSHAAPTPLSGLAAERQERGRKRGDRGRKEEIQTLFGVFQKSSSGLTSRTRRAPRRRQHHHQEQHRTVSASSANAIGSTTPSPIPMSRSTAP